VSPRKPKPPPLAPGATRRYTLKVVCGDKSQHSAVVLHHLADMRGLDFPQAFRALEGRNELRTSIAGDGTVAYKFRCPRCLKTPPPGARVALAEIYDGLSALAGEHHPVLDISALP
jgi:hypothetical protein